MSPQLSPIEERWYNWVPAGAAIALLAWGANQYASLMPVYRSYAVVNEFLVTLALGIYVVGLLPALLLFGTFSDRFGRQWITGLALALGLASSCMMIFAGKNITFLFGGRVVAGIATGSAIAATSSWVTELSERSHPRASAGSGALNRSRFGGHRD